MRSWSRGPQQRWPVRAPRRCMWQWRWRLCPRGAPLRRQQWSCCCNLGRTLTSGERLARAGGLWRLGREGMFHQWLSCRCRACYRFCCSSTHCHRKHRIKARTAAPTGAPCGVLCLTMREQPCAARPSCQPTPCWQSPPPNGWPTSHKLRPFQCISPARPNCTHWI